MNRIDSLDWQRGLLAVAIMVYHLIGWELHALDASSLLGRLGVYGVSMFFVLSGLSMALAYGRGSGAAGVFFARRVFRIWPLFWLAVAFAACVASAVGQAPSWRTILVNLTLTFGFVKPAAGMNVGAWSIGSEVVYYAITPALIAAYNRRLVLGNALTACAVGIALWFALVTLTPDKLLMEQWALYVNPLNNLFLYCAGIALYFNCRQVELGARANAVAFVAALAVFLFYPATGDQINIVTGASRVAFSVASILMVLAFYKTRLHVPAAAAFTKLGAVSYGIYLLHPIVYRTVLFGMTHAHVHMPAPAMIAVTIGLTITAALASFELLEQPFVRIGKRLTSRIPVRSKKLPELVPRMVAR